MGDKTVCPPDCWGAVIAVPAAQAQACLESLQRQGYAEAAIIGEVRPLENAQAPLTL
jgi:hydrogenase maturation factor